MLRTAEQLVERGVRQGAFASVVDSYCFGMNFTDFGCLRNFRVRAGTRRTQDCWSGLRGPDVMKGHAELRGDNLVYPEEPRNTLPDRNSCLAVRLPGLDLGLRVGLGGHLGLRRNRRRGGLLRLDRRARIGLRRDDGRLGDCGGGGL